ncbi:MAG: polysaccharide deacetylase family protein [Myxococcota bacterium]|nr:polysaccharide deacetylase family protein [Myxococcota bacterium]
MKACISIDMDNYRDYQSLVDSKGEKSDISFFSDSVPRFLDELDRVGARATFFMIGKDAARASNRAAVREIADRGHEVANHSYSHPYNFRDFSREQRVEEIRAGEEAIADIVGVRPLGFRAPSGDVDVETLSILRERGYIYDSSVIPSPPLVWLFMLYGKLFIQRSEYNLGRFWSVMAPPWPYFPGPEKLHRPVQPGPGPEPLLVEIPFSTVPIIRFPFYSTLMRLLPTFLFDAAVRAHGTRRPTLHMLFHLIELYDLEGTSLGEGMGRMPGLGVSIARRREFVAHAFARMARDCEAVALLDVARDYVEQETRGERGTL